MRTSAQSVPPGTDPPGTDLPGTELPMARPVERLIARGFIATPAVSKKTFLELKHQANPYQGGNNGIWLRFVKRLQAATQKEEADKNWKSWYQLALKARKDLQIEIAMPAAKVALAIAKAQEEALNDKANKTKSDPLGEKLERIQGEVKNSEKLLKTLKTRWGAVTFKQDPRETPTAVKLDLQFHELFSSTDHSQSFQHTKARLGKTTVRLPITLYLPLVGDSRYQVNGIPFDMRREETTVVLLKNPKKIEASDTDPQKEETTPVAGVLWKNFRDQGIHYARTNGGDLWQLALVELKKAAAAQAGSPDWEKGIGWENATDWKTLYWIAMVSFRNHILEITAEAASRSAKFAGIERQQKKSKALIDTIEKNYARVTFQRDTTEETALQKGYLTLDITGNLINTDKKNLARALRRRLLKTPITLPYTIYLPFGSYEGNNVPFEVKRGETAIAKTFLYPHPMGMESFDWEEIMLEVPPLEEGHFDPIQD